MTLLIDNYDSFSYNLYQLIGELGKRYPSGVSAEGGSDPGESIEASSGLKRSNARCADRDCGELNPDIRVIRNDEMTVEEIRALKPDRIILSPGPGRPEDAGITVQAAKELGKDIPLLGVCLGHQAICAAFGATVTYAKALMHGKQSVVRQEGDSPLFAGLPETFPVARYHSLAAAPETMPECLQVTARTEDGEVMAVRHRDYPVYGVQFHPESILTPDGKQMLKNFMAL